MKKWAIAIVVCAMCGLAKANNVVSFTSAEGYSAGELILSPDWTGSGAAGFVVDPSGAGSVTLGTAAFKNMNYIGGIQPVSGTTYTVSALFSFEGTDTSSQTVDKSVYSINFYDGASKIQLLFRRVVGGAFDIGFFENSGSVNAGGNTVDLSPAVLGLGSTLSVSDQLRLLLTITRGTSETDWTYNGRLEDIDTATTLRTISGTFESAPSFFTNNVTTGISSVSLASDANISPITIQEYSVATINPNVVGFTSLEGYSTGDLTLNPGWSGSTSFLVNPFGSGSVTNVGALGFKNVSYIGGIQSATGASYTVSSLFTFEGADSSSQAIAKGVYYVTFVDGTKRIQGMFRRVVGGYFDIAFYEDSGSVNASGNTVDIPPALLGLGSTLSVSDQLRLSMTITRGTSETDWSYSVHLENVDTTSTLGTYTGTFESSVSFFTNDVTPGMSSSSAASESEISPLTIQEFRVLTVDPNVVGFTSEEGYSAGELSLNPGWSGSTSFLVDPFGSGSVTNVGAEGFKNLSYIGGIQSVAGTSYTVNSLFTFEGTDTSSQVIDKGVYMVTFVDGIKKVQLIFRRVVGGDFDVAFFENSGSVDASSNGANVSPVLLGLGSTLSVSDQLRLSLTITRGTSETDWSYSGHLENVDTATTLSSVAGTFESSVAFFTNDVTPGMSSGSAASESDISPLTVQEFSVVSTTTGAPVIVETVLGTPEWVGPNLLKVVVGSNGLWENLKLVGSSDLVNVAWSYVAHSDDGVNPFVVTNLSYSTVIDSTNHVIYVQAINSAGFFGTE